MDKYAPLYLCLGCSECYGQCNGAADSNCSGAPEAPGACDDPGSTCAECLDCAQLPGAACYADALACNQVSDCSNLVACFNVCVNGA
jgi:hypothetical protein